MKSRFLSFMSLLVACIGGLGVGILLILSDAKYSEIEEFTCFPVWYQATMYIALLIGVISIILSFFFRNVNNTYKIEILIEGVIIFLGFVGLLFSLAREESNEKGVIIYVGAAFLSLGIFSVISTTIGLNRKKDKREEKKLNKENKIIITSMIIGLAIISIGIIGDMVFWTYAKKSMEIGHGFPFFSTIGLLFVIIYIVVMRLFFCFKKKKTF